eukprot:CAMPEP_0184501580 /NCGR_PEP_ID=MMETSP0113_2-20130426/48060_1 /TAXON_ID=91329 /ORGANISM="Norrisiella sphaerica, Strain BC52" /LENGTH=121 /DNA_ID=CAMNT_0026890389 /DNA_START=107 /DNA_END=472 /DNA_ORIENTATION=+
MEPTMEQLRPGPLRIFSRMPGAETHSHRVLPAAFFALLPRHISRHSFVIGAVNSGNLWKSPSQSSSSSVSALAIQDDGRPGNGESPCFNATRQNFGRDFGRSSLGGVGIGPTTSFAVFFGA